MTILDKIIRVISAIFLVAGIITFLIGRNLPKYTNKSEFDRRYQEFFGNSKTYWALRDEYLTNSFKVEDYGLTIISVGVCLLLSVTIFQRSPKSKIFILFMAALSSVLVLAASIASLYQDYTRGEFPPWADSLGIPLAGMPVIGATLLVWGGLHCLFMQSDFSTSVGLLRLPLKRWNPWLGFVIFATLVILVACVIEGYFWYVIPAFSWLYFYQSLNVGRRNQEAKKRGLK